MKRWNKRIDEMRVLKLSQINKNVVTIVMKIFMTDFKSEEWKWIKRLAGCVALREGGKGKGKRKERNLVDIVLLCRLIDKIKHKMTC